MEPHHDDAVVDVRLNVYGMERLKVAGTYDKMASDSHSDVQLQTNIGNVPHAFLRPPNGQARS